MSEASMRAVLLYGVKDMKLEDVDIPEVGPGETLVRVRAATTCGTDLKIYRRGYIEKIIKPPHLFGHEWAGDVVEAGEGVEGIEKGMRIRAGNSTPCYRCPMCVEAKYNLCENMTWLWGAYAEYIKVPATIVKHNIHIIPPHVSYEEAAITEPLACVVHGALVAGTKLGDTVAIIGSGPIGILHMQLAKRLGSERVIISGHHEERLRVAEKLGADEGINAHEEDTVKRVMEMTNNEGADVVIEAIGRPETWEEALKLIKRGGTVLEFGGCPLGTKIEADTKLIHYDEVRLIGTFHATPEEFTKAFNLITSGMVNVKPLITRKMPLGDIHRAFEDLTVTKRDLKIAIIP